MSISKDIVNNIRLEIKEVLEANSTIFPEVSAFPKAMFEEFPAVVIMPSENESDYGDTDSQKRTFVFNLTVYYPTKDEADQEKVELAVGEAVGELLRVFATSELATCLWVAPIPAAWGESTIGDHVYRTARVTLRCVTYFAK